MDLVPLALAWLRTRPVWRRMYKPRISREQFDPKFCNNDSVQVAFSHHFKISQYLRIFFLVLYVCVSYLYFLPLVLSEPFLVPFCDIFRVISFASFWFPLVCKQSLLRASLTLSCMVCWAACLALRLLWVVSSPCSSVHESVCWRNSMLGRKSVPTIGCLIRLARRWCVSLLFSGCLTWLLTGRLPWTKQGWYRSWLYHRLSRYESAVLIWSFRHSKDGVSEDCVCNASALSLQGCDVSGSLVLKCNLLLEKQFATYIAI